MSTIDVKRVFIASPGGLDQERKTVRRVVDDFNKTTANAFGLEFKAIGWEEAVGGMGRPQERINQSLRECEYFVMLLGSRWGSPPDVAGQTTYESGTEEEWNVALQCSDAGTMKQLVIVFKGVPAAQLADPGPQLAKVLDFKKKVEAEKQHLFKTFDQLEELEHLVRKHLGAWLHALVKETPPVARTELTDAASKPQSQSTAERPGDPQSNFVQEGIRLASAGRLTEAEVQFARAISRGDDPRAFYEYGWFLHRMGRIDHATAMFERVAELARAEDGWWTAVSENAIGSVLMKRGKIVAAEIHFRRALSISEQHDHREPEAAAYGGLGMIFQERGDFDSAEEMHKRSLQIEEEIGNRCGVASGYGNLGVALQGRGDLDAAEEMYRKSLAIHEQLDNPEGIVAALTNLGVLLSKRADADGAEHMQRRSLAVAESIGDLEGISNSAYNLGSFLDDAGNLSGAEEMLRRAVSGYEQLGRAKYLTYACGNLSLVLDRLGKADEAAEYRRRAEELSRAPDGEKPAA